MPIKLPLLIVKCRNLLTPLKVVQTCIIFHHASRYAREFWRYLHSSLDTDQIAKRINGWEIENTVYQGHFGTAILRRGKAAEYDMQTFEVDRDL